MIGDRQKPIILFLHGFMGNSNDFLEVIGLISSQFYCLVVDLPGHGKTKVRQDDNYQIPNICQALIQLLKTLKIKSCFLVGYSMGGRIALYLAIYFSHYFKGVILESASPGLRTQAERELRIKQDFNLIEKLRYQDFTLFLQQWYSNTLFTSFTLHPNYQQAIARRLDNNPFKLAKSLLHGGLGKQPSLWNHLPEAHIPMLLVVGELDRKFIAINQQIDLLCRFSKLEIVKNSGHNVHFEQTLEFVQLIKSFIQSTD